MLQLHTIFLRLLCLLGTLLPLHATASERIAAQLLSQFSQAVAELQSYQVIMTKQQRINGQLRPIETMNLKHRREPRCLYMKWIAQPKKGRELIYCPARNDGQIKVHEGGFWNIATLSLDPNGRLAMRDNLHPVSMAGLYALEQLAPKTGSGLEYVKRQANGQSIDCVISLEALELAAYVAQRQELCLHPQHHLPVHLKLWNADNELMEHYSFRDYQQNMPMDDEVFDVDNALYGF